MPYKWNPSTGQFEQTDTTPKPTPWTESKPITQVQPSPPPYELDDNTRQFFENDFWNPPPSPGPGSQEQAEQWEQTGYTQWKQPQEPYVNPLNPTDNPAYEFPIAGAFINPEMYKYRTFDEVAKQGWTPWKPEGPERKGLAGGIGEFLTDMWGGISDAAKKAWGQEVQTPALPYALPLISEEQKKSLAEGMSKERSNPSSMWGQAQRVGEFIMNLFQGLYESTTQPVVGLVGAGGNLAFDLLDNWANKGMKQPLGTMMSAQRIEAAVKAAGLDKKRKEDLSFTDFANLGRVLYKQSPQIFTGVMDMFFDPTNYIPEGLATKALKLGPKVVKGAGREVLEGALRNLDELYPAVKKAGELTEKLGPFALDQESRRYLMMRDIAENAMASRAGRNVDDTFTFLWKMASPDALENPEAYARLVQDFGTGAKTRAGQAQIQLTQGLRDVIDTTMEKTIAARNAITGNIIDTLDPQAFTKELREAVTKIREKGLTGQDALKAIDDAARTQLWADFVETMRKNVDTAFGKIPEPTGVRALLRGWNNALRSIEGLLYIGWSPVTLGRNIINNKFTMALEGINPFLPTEARIAALKRINPAKAEAYQQALNVRKELFQTRDAINRSLRRNTKSSLFGEMPKIFDSIPSLNKLYQAIENADRALAWESGYMRALKNNWVYNPSERQGLGRIVFGAGNEPGERWIPGIPQATIDHLNEIDPSGALFRSIVTAVNESGLDSAARKRFVEAAMDGRIPAVNYDNLAANLGLRMGVRGMGVQTLRSLMGDGADDFLKDVLENIGRRMSEMGADYPTIVAEEIDNALNRMLRQYDDVDVGQPAGNFVLTFTEQQQRQMKTIWDGATGNARYNWMGDPYSGRTYESLSLDEKERLAQAIGITPELEPTIITDNFADLEDQLRALGYTDTEISAMTPDDARDLVDHQIPSYLRREPVDTTPPTRPATLDPIQQKINERLERMYANASDESKQWIINQFALEKTEDEIAKEFGELLGRVEGVNPSEANLEARYTVRAVRIKHNIPDKDDYALFKQWMQDYDDGKVKPIATVAPTPAPVDTTPTTPPTPIEPAVAVSTDLELDEDIRKAIALPTDDEQLAALDKLNDFELRSMHNVTGANVDKVAERIQRIQEIRQPIADRIVARKALERYRQAVEEQAIKDPTKIPQKAWDKFPDLADKYKPKTTPADVTPPVESAIPPAETLPPPVQTVTNPPVIPDAKKIANDANTEMMNDLRRLAADRRREIHERILREIGMPSGRTVTPPAETRLPLLNEPRFERETYLPPAKDFSGRIDPELLRELTDLKYSDDQIENYIRKYEEIVPPTPEPTIAELRAQKSNSITQLATDQGSKAHLPETINYALRKATGNEIKWAPGTYHTLSDLSLDELKIVEEYLIQKNVGTYGAMNRDLSASAIRNAMPGLTATEAYTYADLFESMARAYAALTKRPKSEWWSRIGGIDAGYWLRKHGANIPLSQVDTSTPNFARWFRQSVVTDGMVPNGTPKQVYHGTPRPGFTYFDPFKKDKNALYGPGFYFTESADVAGGKVGTIADWTYHDTEEAAWAVPNRNPESTVWFDTGYDGASNKWIGVVDRPAYESKGYAAPRITDFIEPELRKQYADTIRQSQRYQFLMGQRSYLTETEKWQLKFNLNSFEETGIEGYLAIVEDQPYNLPALRILEDAGVVHTGAVYPVYLRIENPVRVDEWITPDIIRKLLEGFKALEKTGLVELLPNYYDKGSNVPELFRAANQHIDILERIPDFITNPRQNDTVAEWLAKMANNVVPTKKYTEWSGVTTNFLQRDLWPMLFKASGYDGITHIGGFISGGEKHRVWIAFDPSQIVSSVGNNGLFTADNILTQELDITDRFYSQMQRTIAKLKQKVSSADLLKMLKNNGVTADEIHWSGLEEYLVTHPTVTRQEIEAAIGPRPVKITETTLKGIDEVVQQKAINTLKERGWEVSYTEVGDGTWTIDNIYRTFQDDYDEMRDEFRYEDTQAYNWEDVLDDFGNIKTTELPDGLVADGTAELMRKAFSGLEEVGVPAKFQMPDLMLPGPKENYREILIQYAPEQPSISVIPRQEGKLLKFTAYVNGKEYPDVAEFNWVNFGVYDTFRTAAKSLEPEAIRKAKKLYEEEIQRRAYYGGHYDQPNVVVHVRASDRVVRNYTFQQANEIMKKIVDGLGITYSSMGSGAPSVAVERGLITPQEAAIVAHYRGYFNNDMTGATRRVLLIDEIQSDWHQTGERKGYFKYSKEKPNLDDLTVETKHVAEEKTANYTVQDSTIIYVTNKKTGDKVMLSSWRDKDTGETKFVSVQDVINRKDYVINNPEDAKNAAIDIWGRVPVSGVVPQGPFSRNWEELAFKDMLLKAIDDGYDAVVWTPAEVQIERYNLNRVVHRLDYTVNWDGSVNVKTYARDLDAVPNFSRTKMDMDDVVAHFGLDVGNRIQTRVGDILEQHRLDLIAFNEAGVDERAVLTAKYGGDITKPIYPEVEQIYDLKGGGESKRILYDQKLVGYANKIGGKYGTKVTESRVMISDPSQLPWQAQQSPLNGKWFTRQTEDDYKMGPYYDTKAQAQHIADEMNQAEDYAKFQTVHTLEITPKMRESLMRDRLPLFQPNYRGAATPMGDGKFLLSFFKNADKSTPVHEIAHIGRKQLEAAARMNPAGAAARDLEIASEWAGAPMREGRYVWTDELLNTVPDEELRKYASLKVAKDRREFIATRNLSADHLQWTKDWDQAVIAEEKFAKGFELYFREGKFPPGITEEVKRVFEQIKLWLLQVYSEMRNFAGIEISDDIRGVYDRMVDENSAKMARWEQEGITYRVKQIADMSPTLHKEVRDTARDMLDDLRGGEPGKRIFLEGADGTGGTREVISAGTTNAQWYRDFYADMASRGGSVNRDMVDKVLEQIADGRTDIRAKETELLLMDIILRRAANGDSVLGKGPGNPEAMMLFPYKYSRTDIEAARQAWKELDLQIAATDPFEDLFNQAISMTGEKQLHEDFSIDVGYRMAQIKAGEKPDLETVLEHIRRAQNHLELPEMERDAMIRALDEAGLGVVDGKVVELPPGERSQVVTERENVVDALIEKANELDAPELADDIAKTERAEIDEITAKQENIKRMGPQKPVELPRVEKYGVPRPIVDGMVQTGSGRMIPAPNAVRTTSNKVATNDIKKLETWLRDQAIAEAESKGDDFNLISFKQSVPGKLTQADKDLMNIYLFGEESPVFSVEVAPTPVQVDQSVIDKELNRLIAERNRNKFYLDETEKDIRNERNKEMRAVYEKRANELRDTISQLDKSIASYSATLPSNLTLKPPYEMTRQEWEAAHLAASKAESQALKSMPSSGQQAQYRWGTAERLRLQYGTEGKPIRKRGVPVHTHHDVIEKALSEGKTVPDNIVAEYPDLVEKYSKPSGPAIAPTKPDPNEIVVSKDTQFITSDMMGDHFTVSRGIASIDIYFDGTRYWGSFKVSPTANGIASMGIESREAAIDWARNMLDQHAPNGLWIDSTIVETPKTSTSDLIKDAQTIADQGRPKNFLKYPTPEEKAAGAKNPQLWQVSESDYVKYAYERELQRLRNNISIQEKNMKAVKYSRKEADKWWQAIEFWKKDLQRKLDNGIDANLRKRWTDEYIEETKKAISHGEPVPEEVIAQRPEFQKAKDARARYEKGRHTSFANKSAAINDTMQAARGFKVKRQDGKQITPEQIAEITKGIDEIESVFGPIKDLLQMTDLTIAHTSGTHPFLSSFGGLYSLAERTVTMGVDGVKALAHELAHWLDSEAGTMVHASRKIKRGEKWQSVPNLSEVEDRTNELIQKATRNINSTYEVEKLFKTRGKEKLTDAEKKEIQKVKVHLGNYWREPAEVWARLMEQYFAKRAGGGVASDTFVRYTKTPGWWTEEVFNQYEPLIEHEINRRLGIMRGDAEKEINKVRFDGDQTFSHVTATRGFGENAPHVYLANKARWKETPSWMVYESKLNRETMRHEDIIIAENIRSFQEAKDKATEYLQSKSAKAELAEAAPTPKAEETPPAKPIETTPPAKTVEPEQTETPQDTMMRIDRRILNYSKHLDDLPNDTMLIVEETPGSELGGFWLKTVTTEPGSLPGTPGVIRWQNYDTGVLKKSSDFGLLEQRAKEVSPQFKPGDRVVYNQNPATIDFVRHAVQTDDIMNRPLKQPIYKQSYAIKFDDGGVGIATADELIPVKATGELDLDAARAQKMKEYLEKIEAQMIKDPSVIPDKIWDKFPDLAKKYRPAKPGAELMQAVEYAVNDQVDTPKGIGTIVSIKDNLLGDRTYGVRMGNGKIVQLTEDDILGKSATMFGPEEIVTKETDLLNRPQVVEIKPFDAEKNVKAQQDLFDRGQPDLFGKGQPSLFQEGDEEIPIWMMDPDEYVEREVKKATTKLPNPKGQDLPKKLEKPDVKPEDKPISSKDTSPTVKQEQKKNPEPAQPPTSQADTVGGRPEGRKSLEPTGTNGGSSISKDVREDRAGVRYISADRLPRPKRFVGEEYLNGIAAKTGGEWNFMEHQADNADRALTAFSNGKGFVIADSTGTGKTYSGVLISDLMHKQGATRQLLVAPNDGLIEQWNAVAKQIGIRIERVRSNFVMPINPPPNTLYATTYSTMIRWDLAKVMGKNRLDLLMFDESHRMKNLLTGDEATKFAQWGVDLQGYADHNLFMSATPVESVLHYAYMADHLGTHDRMQSLLNKLGIYKGTLKDAITGEERTIWEGLSPKKLAALHEELVRDGTYVRHEMSYKAIYDKKTGELKHAYTAAIRIPMTERGVYEYQILMQAIDDTKEAFPQFAKNLEGMRVMIGKALLESQKVPVAIELGMLKAAEDKSVAFFVMRKSDSDWEGLMAQLEGKPMKKALTQLYSTLQKNGVNIKSPVQRLIEAFPEAILITGDVVGPLRDQNIKAFQSGKARVAIVTQAAGGTGLSLHDKIGAFQRVQINLTSPYTAMDMEQIAGRTFRMGSQSDAEIYWMFNDIPLEETYARRVMRRMSDMGALVRGEEALADEKDMLEFIFKDIEAQGEKDKLEVFASKAVLNLKPIITPPWERPGWVPEYAPNVEVVKGVQPREVIGVEPGAMPEPKYTMTPDELSKPAGDPSVPSKTKIAVEGNVVRVQTDYKEYARLTEADKQEFKYVGGFRYNPTTKIWSSTNPNAEEVANKFFRRKPNPLMQEIEDSARLMPAQKEIVEKLKELEARIWSAKTKEEAAAIRAEYSALFAESKRTGTPISLMQEADNADTALQQWGRGSKVVDNKGNLAPMYHGTIAKNEFTVFQRKPGQIGIHFGTQAQANSRLSQLVTFRRKRPKGTMHERVMPVYLRVKNPLELDDTASWEFGQVASQLEKIGIITQKEILGIFKRNNVEPQDRHLLFDEWGRWRTFPPGMIDDLRAFLKSKGYDGIKYKNWYEPDVAPERAKEFARIQSRLKMLREKIGDVPWGTPRFEDIRDEISVLMAKESDLEKTAYSWIVFDPDQIKSATGNLGSYGRGIDNILWQDNPETLNPRAWTEDNQRFIDEFARVLREELLRNPPPNVRANGAVRNEVYDWLTNQVDPAAKDAQRAAMAYGDWLEKSSVLDYGQRWNVDNWLSYLMPFPFWRNHYAAETLRRVLDHPWMAGKYAMMQRELDKQQNSKEFPSRLRGKTVFPLPGVGNNSWMGNRLFFDPSETIAPIKQVVRSITGGGFEPKVYDTDVADAIRMMAERGAISRSEAEYAITNPEKAKLWADTRASMEKEIDDAESGLNIFGLHTPYQILLKIQQGRPEDIGILFPFTRLARAASSTDIPFVKNMGQMIQGIEPALRKNFGIPEYEATYQYYIDRMLSTLVAQKEITPRDAEIAMLERVGPAYELAVKRANQEQAVKSLSPLTATDIFPAGERLIYSARIQRDALLDKSLKEKGININGMGTTEKWAKATELGLTARDKPFGRFLELHPEINIKNAAYDPQDLRLKSFLVQEFWNRYNKLSALDRRMFRKEQNDQVLDTFIDKTTRDYSKVSNEMMATWAQAIGGYVPKAKDVAAPISQEKLEKIKLYINKDPKLSAAYKVWVDRLNEIASDPAYIEYKAKKDAISQIEDGYYTYTDALQKRLYLQQYPQLQMYWDWLEKFRKTNPRLNAYLTWNSEFWKAFPEISNMLYGNTKVETTTTGTQTVGSAPDAIPTGAPKLNQKIPAYLINAYENWLARYKRVVDDPQWKEYESMSERMRPFEQQYFALPQGAARQAYLKTVPQLKSYWDWKDAWAMQNPELAAYKEWSSQFWKNYPELQELLYGKSQSYMSAPTSGTGATAPGTSAQGSTAKYTPGSYVPTKTETVEKGNTYTELIKGIKDPTLIMALQEYLYQSRAGRPSVLAKYPQLQPILSKFDAAGLDKLTSDYLLQRRVGKVNNYYGISQ